MKTVYLTRDFDYTPHPKFTVRFERGQTYTRVLDAAARAIERADAGRVLFAPQGEASPPNSIDASKCWRARGNARR